MSYTIAGRKILNEHIVIGVLGSYALGGYLLSRGSGQPKTADGAAPAKPEPPINAATSEEEAFIKNFLAAAEGDKNAERLV